MKSCNGVFKETCFTIIIMKLILQHQKILWYTIKGVYMSTNKNTVRYFVPIYYVELKYLF